ncbi:MAG: glycerol-3-phosphate dehydrogenase/oxidase [Acidimicrobiales bacterium]
MASFDRPGALKTMATSIFDVVVIGAGMTGAGVALDAATRGLSVALIDAGDFASGTSSKSSKLVHGGLRYLQQREFRLVYENLRERQRLLENAPFLVRPLPFLIPLISSNSLTGRTLVRGYSSALRLYDLTGGWRIGQRHRKVTPTEALAHLPTLRAEHLLAGFIYMDARGDDARVALALARTAVDHGAWAANYVRAIDFSRDDAARTTGVIVRDELTGDTFSIAARSVVNATGVWADEIIQLTSRSDTHQITPAKGVHASVPRERLPIDIAAVLAVPGDRRSVFVVPFEDGPFTFIGTTDTPYDGEIDTPTCTPEDLNYLLQAVNAATTSDLTPRDVSAVWAGLRPLLSPREGEHLSGRTADLSRRHRVSDLGDGVVHVTGGKWTTYRQMAEDAVDALAPYVGRVGTTRTKKLRLHGYGSWRPTTPLDTHLYQRYGDDARAVLELISQDPSLALSPIDGLDYVMGEFVYGARAEMATSLIDLLTRRTRAHLIDARATLDAAPQIALAVAPHLGWDEERCGMEVGAYRDLVTEEFTSAGLVL